MIQPFNPDDGGLLSPETVQSSQHSKKLKLPERPKHVLEMEERAKSRKDKRDQLKKTYEEKQKKIEEERRAAEAKKEEERRKKLADEKEAKRAGKME